MNRQKNALRMALQAIKAIDAELRAGEKCAVCGKPVSGVVPAGMTTAQAGLCVCKREAAK